MKTQKIATNMPPLTVVDCGVVSYGKGLNLQKHFHSLVVENPKQAFLLLCQHDPPVITMGKNASLKTLLVTPEELAKHNIALLRTHRGGDITYHATGQLMVYPILPITDMGMGVKSYVYSLEQAFIDVLQSLGITAEHDSYYPGVWVRGEETKDGIIRNKIAATGVAIQKKTTLHGMAINIHLNLTPFTYIIPCGIKDPLRGITTVVQELTKPVSDIYEYVSHNMIKALEQQWNMKSQKISSYLLKL